MSGIPIEPPTCRACPHVSTSWYPSIMEITLAKLCDYVRLVAHERRGMYVRVSGVNRDGRSIVHLRMKSAITTSASKEKIARDTCRALKPILDYVVGWKLEVCPACIEKRNSEYKSGTFRVKSKGRNGATLWVRMWEDMWVLASYDGIKVTPFMSYKEGYCVCNDWSDSYTMAGIYRHLGTLVDELHNRGPSRPILE